MEIELGILPENRKISVRITLTGGGSPVPGVRFPTQTKAEVRDLAVLTPEAAGIKNRHGVSPFSCQLHP